MTAQIASRFPSPCPSCKAVEAFTFSDGETERLVCDACLYEEWDRPLGTYPALRDEPVALRVEPIHVREEGRGGLCPNGPDEYGNWPCERGPDDACVTCGWRPGQHIDLGTTS